MISRINKGEVNINALFIQPTTYCALDCTGCYVKEWEQKTGQSTGLTSETLLALLCLFSNPYSSHSVNQITLALDTVPWKAPPSVRDHLLKLHDTYLFYAHALKFNGPEFHITTQSVKTLHSYCSYRTAHIEIDLNGISVLSFSSLFDKDMEDVLRLKEFNSRLLVNYNYQPKMLKQTEYEKELMRLKKILSFTDHLYYILHKPDLGQAITQDVIKNHLGFYSFMMTNLLEKEKTKITMDGCVSDAKNYSETGYGCSSNISRFQVWPDGSVSGCPYKQTASTSKVDQKESSVIQSQQILDNIIEANKTYDFDRCKIPENFYPNSPIVARNKRKTLVIVD